MWAFPLAGVVVGLIGALVYALAHRLGLPSMAVRFHWRSPTTSGRDRLPCMRTGSPIPPTASAAAITTERKLDIMRDSRIGTYGVCALALSLLLRAGALASVAEPGNGSGGP